MAEKMIVMYYVLDKNFKKKYIPKAIVGKLRRLGYKIYQERLL